MVVFLKSFIVDQSNDRRELKTLCELIFRPIQPRWIRKENIPHSILQWQLTFQLLRCKLINPPIKTDILLQIKRRYKNFLTLHQELSHHVPKEILPNLPKKKRLGVLDPAFVEERRSSLELYLQQVSSIREAWSCPRFVEFLDDSHPFLGIQIQVAKLTDEIHCLRYYNSMITSQLQEATAALVSSNISLASLDARLKVVEHRDDKVFTSRDNVSSSSNRVGVPGNNFSGVIGPDLSSPTMSSREKSPQALFAPNVPRLSTEGNRFSNEENAVQTESTTNKYPSWARNYTNKSDYRDVVSDSHHTIGSELLASPPGLPLRHSLDRFPSSFLSIDDVPSNEIPSMLDHFTDTILSYVLPSKEQLQFRYNVEKYIAKLVRKSLGAQLCQMGIQLLRCFLPDDPISLSIYLCRGLENSWYFRLNEKLCRMSAGGNSSSPATVNSPSRAHLISTDGAGDGENELSTSLDTGLAAGEDRPSMGENDTTPSSSHHNHVISHVSFMNEHGEYRLQCLAGSTVVDIRANMKIDICFVAYLEEIDRIVGRDHLFKKSISLIRIWWTKETPADCKTVTSSEYMPDTALLIMICAVFNQFHHRIFSPFQALCFFSIEYASFDWSSNGLTAYGPICLSANPDSFKASFGGIIPPKMTAKYMDMLADGADLSLKDVQVSQSRKTPPSLDDTAGSAAPPPRRGSLTMLFGAVLEAENVPEEDDNPSKESTDTGLAASLTSEYIKIWHPLQPSTNTVPETMTHHFVGIMSDALKFGQEQINNIIMLDSTNRAMPDDIRYKHLENAIRNLFSETVQRFGKGWRPDVINPSHYATFSDDEHIQLRLCTSETQSPGGATTNPQFLQDMKTSEDEFM